MDHTLHIQLSDSEGAVLRALGLMERRGYSIKCCAVGEITGAARDLDVTVTSSRSGDLLKRQLERLHDVRHVDLKPAEPVQPKHPGIRPVNRSASP
jgi:acetolactate synthase regulatory subunit